MGEAAAAGDLANVFRWADSLGRFLDTGEGLVLLAGFRRAHEVLRDCEQDETIRFDEKPQPGLYRRKEERELAIAIALCRREASAALENDDFDLAMRAIATLRPFLQAFFDKVEFVSAVMDLRENRLRLLNELCGVLLLVGDLSKIRDEADVA
jgi:glycyl-tRNA synthetase beta chain